MIRELKVLLLFSVAAVGLYAGALSHPFHYDDLHSIQHNPHIRTLHNIDDFFTDLHTFSSERSGTMFRPLLLTSYAVNYALHGDDVRGFRAFNIALHVLCSFALYLLVRRLRESEVVALISSSIFLLHPLHSEPINYISSRSDMLAAFAVLWGSVAALEEDRRGAWVAVTLLIAGLLCKSVVVVLPICCALVHAHRDSWTKVWNFRYRYVAMGLIVVLYGATIYFNSFLPTSLEKAPRSFDVQIWTQIKGLVYYLWIFVAPVRLNVDHQFFVAQKPGEWVVLLSALLLGSMLFFAWKGRRTLPGVAFLWVLIGLAPASLMPLNILVSERRAYLASVGLCLVVAWIIDRGFRKRASIRRLLVVALLGLFAIIAHERNAVWTTGLSLWQDAVAKGPLVPRSRVNLALAYGKQERWQESIEHLRVALRIQPEYADAWVELGNIEHGRGRLVEAEAAYRKAVQYKPNLAGGRYNLGNVYQQQGDLKRAVFQYEKALFLNPNFARAHNNLGQALEGLGMSTEAIGHYRQALEIDARLSQAWFNLALARERQRDFPQAIAAYQQASSLLVNDNDYATNVQFQYFAQRARESIERLKKGYREE
jgi:tetratricopeptide (TPR) repeat protein